MGKHTTNPYTGQPYRGWRSTKLHLALITMAAIFAAFGLGGFNPASFEWFVIGLIGASGIYSGGNVVEKIRGLRGGAPVDSAPPPEAPAPLPPGGA